MASWRFVFLLALTACAATPAKPAAPHAPRWRGDFETGNLLQWSYLLNPRGLSVVEAPVAQGRHAARVEITERDLWPNGLNRVEVEYKPPRSALAEGQRSCFSWRFFLPAALSEIDERVLMLAPTGRDGELMCTVLEDAGVRCRVCADMLDLCTSLHEGGAALLIAEEALADGAYRDLTAVLAQQPPWSEPPILLLSERGADSEIINEALENLGNVTVLERPTRVPTLVSAVHSALRSRQIPQLWTPPTQ